MVRLGYDYDRFIPEGGVLWSLGRGPTTWMVLAPVPAPKSSRAAACGPGYSSVPYLPQAQVSFGAYCSRSDPAPVSVGEYFWEKHNLDTNTGISQHQARWGEYRRRWFGRVASRGGHVPLVSEPASSPGPLGVVRLSASVRATRTDLVTPPTRHAKQARTNRRRSLRVEKPSLYQ